MVNTTTASTFGTKAFNRQVQWKMVMWVRAITMNVRILYIDSDIVLLKDPFLYLNSIEGYDIIVQKDHHICSGFMYMYPTNKTKKVLRKTLQIRLENKFVEDQTAMITAVKRTPDIRLLFLPLNLFSSGEYFFRRHSYYWDPISKEQIMFHNNFVIGPQSKVYRFKELKMYKLDIDGEYSNPNAKYLTIELMSIILE